MTGPIRVDDVFVVYRTAFGDAPSLQGVSLDVAAGEIVGIIGPSGSGKSTLLRVIAGLEIPASGDVDIGGTVVSRLAGQDRATFRARHIGVISQYATETLPPDLAARDAVALQARLLGTPTGTALDVADSLLDEVGLSHLRTARTRSLSGGERQRVAVCAALAHGPELILADEPTGELDAASSATVHEMMARIIRRHSATAIIVSHDPGAAAHADRALAIADGRLAEEQIDGRSTLVIGPGGWVRLPAEVLAHASLGDRATAEASPAEVRLRGLGAPPPPPAAPAPTPAVPTDRADDAVRLDGVSKAFGDGAGRRDVLDAISARIAPGALTAVVGRSGSGKSTLLHVIAGMVRPDAGSVAVAGNCIDLLDDAEAAALRRRDIALVTQDVGLVPFLSAVENLTLAMAIRGEPEDVALARTTLASVGLDARAGHLVEHLSAGERQRVAIARALSAAPAVLLLDEPTSRLDRVNGHAIADLLEAICRTRGTAVVCATHDDEIVARADAIVDLDARTARRSP